MAHSGGEQPLNQEVDHAPADLELSQVEVHPSTTAPHVESEFWDANSIAGLVKQKDYRNHQRPLYIETNLYKYTLGQQIASVPPFGVPAGLEILDNTNHLILQSTTERAVELFNDTNNNFELLNTTGERILFLIDSFDPWRRAYACNDTQNYTYSMREHNGKEDFLLEGNSRWFGYGNPDVAIMHNRRTLGRVMRTGEFGSTRFTVYNANKRPKFVGVPVPSYNPGPRPPFKRRYMSASNIDIDIPTELDIWSPDMTVKVGRVTSDWAGYYEGVTDPYSTADTSVHKLVNNGYGPDDIAWLMEGGHFGVSFASDLSLTSRALLIGIVVMLDFQVYEDKFAKSNSQIRKKQCKFIQV